MSDLFSTGPKPHAATAESEPVLASEFPLRARLFIAIVLIVILLGVPLMNPSYRFTSVAISTGISAITLYGLSIIFGLAGILSVGHAAMMGVGAYTVAILSQRLGLGFWTGGPVAMVATALVAGLLGLASLRVAGHHFIIITFAFGSLFSIVMTNGGSLTGSAAGLDVETIYPLFGVDFDKINNYYFLVVLFLLVAILITFLIMVSPYGRTLRAIRENESLAAAIGINARKHKIVAFMISGLFAGLGGSLQAYYLRHISPTLFGSSPSVYLALMVMVGGPRKLFGPIAGAVIVYFLPEVLQLDPIDSRIAYGLGLILVIMLLPGGVAAGIGEIWTQLLRQISLSGNAKVASPHPDAEQHNART